MLKVQRRLAAQIMKCGINRVKFDSSRMDDIKEAITKRDVKSLISSGAISKGRGLNASRFWARLRKEQKSYNKQKGHGSRKGKRTARLNSKRTWINKIRLQRRYLKSLRDSNAIATHSYHELYMKSKGGFFRSLRHLKLYLNERGLVKDEKR
ncbi:50S ribosomal protein L19e [Candidatus Woesearchaeota archaeon]|nr:50S ribosomal protein L19e [Candidatus Woesearchaeota archaeon]